MSISYYHLPMVSNGLQISHACLQISYLSHEHITRLSFILFSLLHHIEPKFPYLGAGAKATFRSHRDTLSRTPS